MKFIKNLIKNIFFAILTLALQFSVADAMEKSTETDLVLAAKSGRLELVEDIRPLLKL